MMPPPASHGTQSAALHSLTQQRQLRRRYAAARPKRIESRGNVPALGTRHTYEAYVNSHHSHSPFSLMCAHGHKTFASLKSSLDWVRFGCGAMYLNV